MGKNSRKIYLYLLSMKKFFLKKKIVNLMYSIATIHKIASAHT